MLKKSKKFQKVSFPKILPEFLDFSFKFFFSYKKTVFLFQVFNF